MAFDISKFRWDPPGTEPSESRKNTGRAPGERIPADEYNFYRNQLYLMAQALIVAQAEDITVDSINKLVPATVIKSNTKPRFKGLSVMHLLKKGNLATSLTSDDSGSTFDWRDDTEAWIFSSAYSTLTKNYRVQSGKKYFLYNKLKNDSVGRIRSVYLRYDDESTTISPTVADSLRIGALLTANYTGLANFKTVESTAGLMERDYQLFIPVSDLGLDALTEEQLTYLADNGFFKGIKNYDEDIKSVGKNQHNMRDLEVNAATLTTMVIDRNNVTFDEIVESGGVFAGKIRVPVIKNQQYALSWDVIAPGDNNLSIFIYEGGTGVNSGERGTQIGSGSLTSSPINFTATNESYIWIGYNLTSAHTVGNPITIGNIQLEFTSDTTFEDYKESTVRIRGKSLPNGITDQEQLKPINDTYLLKDSDITDLITTPVNVDYVKVLKNSDYKYATIATGADNKSFLIDGFLPYESGSTDDISNEYRSLATFDTDEFLLIIPKGLYATLQEAKDDLEGTELIYLLLQPQERTDSEVLTIRKDGVIKSVYLPTELILEDAANNEAQQVQGVIDAATNIANRLPMVIPQYIIDRNKWVDDTGTSGFWLYTVDLKRVTEESDGTVTYFEDDVDAGLTAAFKRNGAKTIDGGILIKAYSQPAADIRATIKVVF